MSYWSKKQKLWGILCPDAGPDDQDAVIEIAIALVAINAELLAACEAAITEFKALGQALGESTPPAMVDAWDKVEVALTKTKGAR
jgi:hypothetical protein